MFDIELGVRRVPDSPTVRAKAEPVLFRGVDCALLAQRYVAYRQQKGLDAPRPAIDTSFDPAETPAVAAGSAEGSIAP